MSFHRGNNLKSELELLSTKSNFTAGISGNRRKISVKEKLRLWFLTLVYHNSFSYEYALDTLIEPVFWFVDHFTYLLGPGFVTIVIILVGSITSIAHVLGIPFWYQKSPVLLGCLVVIGYWILLNLTFNFYKVATVSPGLPSDASELAKCSVTICKKCISPKPQRTHHCSICNKCYLNMDHHCPWVNNCVGHFNRRYFFLCMVYIVVGCCYVMLFGVELAFREVILDQNILPYCSNDTEEISHFHDGSLFEGAKSIQDDTSFLPSNDSNADDLLDDDNCDEEFVRLFLGISATRRAFRLTLYFAGVLCIGTSLALGGLSLWHAKLITMGETSIEYHVNRSERKKSKKDFVNAYDLGKKRNWEVFFGLDQPNITFFRHVLLPSSHLPSGSGYDWSHITSQARILRKESTL